MSDLPSTRQSLCNGLRLRCPKCGEGKLFKSYLKQQDCPHCRESFEGLRADDGPAWLTILVTGHIMVPLLILLQRSELLPLWAVALLMMLATTALVLALLPCAKGLFIAVLWLLARKKAKSI